MKVSPPWYGGVLEARVAVVEDDSPIESLVDLHLGTDETEAAGLLRDLEAAAFPLHDVVVADDAFVHEAADAVEAFWSRPPGSFHFAGHSGETAIVIGDEFAQHGVGGIEVMSTRKAEFTAQAILQHTPESLDAAFGLGTVGGDESDAELFQCAAELGGLAFSRELFFDRPGVVVADKDAAAITIKSQRHTAAAQHLAKQAEVAESGLGREELRGQDLAGGIVLHAESGEARAATFQPVMRAAVELHQFAEASGTHPALAMSGSAALARRALAIATGAPTVLLMPVNYMRNKNDPTGFDVPFFARKKEAKLFGDLNDFHFEDGHTFDFRGEAARSAEDRGGTLSDSNQRASKGFRYTFALAKTYGGLVGEYKLDWFFVKGYATDSSKAEGSYKFAPHFARTLQEVNEAPDDSLSDHFPIAVDVPLTEPPLKVAHL